ncbi:GGDEF domain-containing protein [Euzebya tangerina]|uniref:GGDEF domain-containing protein n=1 Tax=Euzebya tangerina TaxID=591198 RepID=UPI0013C2FC82|nr:GGDEF domain-containing protein [Euzebya tangerina]
MDDSAVEPMMTSPRVAELVSRVQFGEAAAARREAERLLAAGYGTTDDATMLQVVIALGCMIEEGPEAAVALLQRRLDELDTTDASSAVERGYLIGLRAHMLVVQDQTPLALEDLVTVETLLGALDHTRHVVRMLSMNVGVTYGFLAMYPLAEEHLAPLVEPHGGPWRQADQMLCYLNLFDNSLRWAQELERAGLADGPDDAGFGAHLDDAERWCTAGLALLDDLPTDDMAAWGHLLRRGHILLLAYRHPSAAIGPARSQLMEDLTSETPGHAAAMASALSLALRRTGQTAEGYDVACQAVQLAADADRAVVLQATYQRHLASMALGRSGSVDAHEALRAAHLTIWQGREQDVEHVRRRRELSSLRAQHRDALAEARRDPLTGVGNRRALDEWLQWRPIGPATAFVIDLDAFKLINDRHGHHVGDRVLQLVATALRQAIRDEDLLVRAGGDEFVVACDGREHDPTAMSLRLARSIASVAVLPELPAGSVTGSVGYAVAEVGEETTKLFKGADRMMFERKQPRTDRRRSRSSA